MIWVMVRDEAAEAGGAVERADVLERGSEKFQLTTFQPYILKQVVSIWVSVSLIVNDCDYMN